MTLNRRLKKAEDDLGDALRWMEAERIAIETGLSPEPVYLEGRQQMDKYRHLEIHLPGGMLDIAPVLRAFAEDEGLDFAELVRDAKRTLRGFRATETRRRNRLR